MRIPRVHVTVPLAGRAQVALDEQAAHHVQRVLRLRRGEPVVLFDGAGGEYDGRLTVVDGRLGAEVEGFRREDRTDPTSATLWQAVCRGGRMDYVIEKATELGVHRIVPLLTRRVVVKLSPERGQQRVAHWQKIAIAACEQCGMNRIPRIDAPMTLADALAHPHALDGEALWLAPGAREQLAALPAAPAAVTLLVGPEGGFAPEEEHTLEGSPFRRVALGPRTLRADTAGLAALSVLGAVATRHPRTTSNADAAG